MLKPKNFIEYILFYCLYSYSSGWCARLACAIPNLSEAAIIRCFSTRAKQNKDFRVWENMKSNKRGGLRRGMDDIPPAESDGQVHGHEWFIKYQIVMVFIKGSKSGD